MTHSNQKLPVYIFCDTIGQSVSHIVLSALKKYPEIDFELRTLSFITTAEEIEKNIQNIADLASNPLIFHAFSNKQHAKLIAKLTKYHRLTSYDVLEPFLNVIGSTVKSSPEDVTQNKPLLNKQYFNRIDALEFAVLNDDGKNPKGFLEADIVLLGVSRTSKTPLSIYLANQNYRVANLPIIPEAEIPQEIWQINARQVFGLTTDADVLIDIRRERMESYGLSPDTIYSSRTRIEKELAHANSLYEKLGCTVINVATRSIEETASLIINDINRDYSS